MYDRILVPTDGSTEVERAVDHAIELASTNDASIHALYVVSTKTFTGLPMEASWESVDRFLREDAEEAVERVRELATTSGIDVATAVAEGKPSREIVEYAEREDCDAVVMGTHGRGGIDRLLLGSVAEAVVRSSSVPVLTVNVREETDDVSPRRV
ncbi:universal stress protein [Haloplanus sp. GCM10025708]|uniref:universal stress protein n=1 Tax=Haloferacaceae TaxID=1644056 RepID=UPI003607E5B4